MVGTRSIGGATGPADVPGYVFCIDQNPWHDKTGEPPKRPRSKMDASNLFGAITSSATDANHAVAILEHASCFQRLLSALAYRLLQIRDMYTSYEAFQHAYPCAEAEFWVRLRQTTSNHEAFQDVWCPSRCMASLSEIRVYLRRLHVFLSTCRQMGLFSELSFQQRIRDAFAPRCLPKVRVAFPCLSGHDPMPHLEIWDCPSSSVALSTAALRTVFANADVVVFVAEPRTLWTIQAEPTVDAFMRTMLDQQRPTYCRFVVNNTATSRQEEAFASYPVCKTSKQYRNFLVRCPEAADPKSMEFVKPCYEQDRPPELKDTRSWLMSVLTAASEHEGKPWRVCVHGTVKAGKSSVVNAIVGTNVSPSEEGTSVVPILFQHDASLATVARHEVPTCP